MYVKRNTFDVLYNVLYANANVLYSVLYNMPAFTYKTLYKTLKPSLVPPVAAEL